jgi:hypothetical protein
MDRVHRNCCVLYLSHLTLVLLSLPRGDMWNENIKIGCALERKEIDLDVNWAV